MTDTGAAPLAGLTHALQRLSENLDMAEEFHRLHERAKTFATREEVNDAQFRTIKEVSEMIGASSKATQQFVRERVDAGALETKNALLQLEAHVAKTVEAAAEKAAQVAVAAVLAATPPAAPKRTGITAAAYGAGATSGVGLFGLVLYLIEVISNGGLG